jgi:hypothetical protein
MAAAVNQKVIGSHQRRRGAPVNKLYTASTLLTASKTKPLATAKPCRRLERELISPAAFLEPNWVSQPKQRTLV